MNSPFAHDDINIFIEKKSDNNFSFEISYFAEEPYILKKFGLSSFYEAEEAARLEIATLVSKYWGKTFHELQNILSNNPHDLIAKNTFMKKAFHLKKGLFHIHKSQNQIPEKEIYPLIDLLIYSSFKDLMNQAKIHILDSLFDVKNEYFISQSNVFVPPIFYNFNRASKQSDLIEEIITNLPGQKHVTIYLNTQKGHFIFDDYSGILVDHSQVSTFHSLTNLALNQPNSFLISQEIPNTQTLVKNKDGSTSIKPWIAAYGFALKDNDIFSFPAEVVEHSFRFNDQGQPIDLPPFIIFKDFNEVVSDFFKSKKQSI